MGMSGDKDEFGDRMKAYEAVETSRAFNPAMPIYARIDGRSFSRFTRNMVRPFDARMTSAMQRTTKTLIERTHARIGYTQSDEISLVWLCGESESEALFGGKVFKLTSVLAGMATAAFTFHLDDCFGAPCPALKMDMPHFDARVFNLPSKTEAANAFLWRAMDARKNSVSMAARAHFSAKQLHGKDQRDMRAMMAEAGTDFETKYAPCFKWGSWFRRENYQRAFTTEELAHIPEQHRPAPDALVMRSRIAQVAMPEFHKVRNRVEVIFEGQEPNAAPEADAA